jgi:hypothetical protein
MRRPYLASARSLKKVLRKKQTTGRPRSANAAAVFAREPVSCGFGAVRVGALLGRLRLHLQTERFLAVHRNDALWEAGCLQASRALAEIVAGIGEEEMSAPLAPLGAQERRALGDPPLTSSGRKNAVIRPGRTAFFSSTTPEECGAERGSR